MPRLAFESGTLTLDGMTLAALPEELRPLAVEDPRSGNLRLRASDYSRAVLALRACGVTDLARRYEVLDDLRLAKPVTPREYQTRALKLWKTELWRGVVALPTGSGKTILAVMAIAELKRSTIILVPTIDLLHQWVEVLEGFFKCEIGVLGGGSRDIRPITVSTYDSAVLNMEFIGNRFGLLIADECHHLPAPETRLAAAMCIAPFRMGLSATPELAAERAAVLAELIGPIVCEVAITELAGSVLSPYRVQKIAVELDADELQSYRFYRRKYTDFLASNQITFGSPSDWGRFLGLCSRSERGREAFDAFLAQRRIARGSEAKVRAVWRILLRHPGEQIIVFTADNDAAYELGRRFMLPVITHRTKLAERREFLEKFRSGEYPVLVTSKVLNEGVDVPSVGVGVVLSGSASVREHVQRLGRILRPAPGKEQAVLYELISSGTGEESVSYRRSQHQAYRRFRGRK